MFGQYAEILVGFLKAFAVGGLICAIAQVVINFTDLTAGKILVIFMLVGVGLQGLGLYQYLVDFAGAGAGETGVSRGHCVQQTRCGGEKAVRGFLWRGVCLGRDGVLSQKACSGYASADHGEDGL